MAAPNKRAALEKFLDQGMVMVHLDARRPGVRVPPALQGDPQLRLNLSYRFASRDLAVGDELVRCTLSFGGHPFYCELPLEAVFAVTSHVTGEALVWPDSLEAAMAESSGGPAAPAPASPLVAVPSEPRSAESGEGEKTEPAVSPARRGHLRLVK